MFNTKETVTLKTNTIEKGLYRHFKGKYYFVKEIVKECSSGEEYVAYFDVIHPELGTFIRSVSDFDTEVYDFNVLTQEYLYIKDRSDNVTGQKKRFERVL